MSQYNNLELKGRLIEKYDKGTKLYYKRILEKAGIDEEYRQKNIYDYNKGELDEFLVSLRPTSKLLAKVYISIIRTYCQFAHDEGYTSNMIIADQILTSELDKYVHTIRKNNKYLTKEQLDDLVNNCVNAQDAVVYQLLWEGIKGKELSEIRNLTISNVDFVNRVITIDNKRINVSAKLIGLIQEANSQTEYYHSNGESESLNKVTALINPAKHIIKSKLKSGDVPIILTTFMKRFGVITQILGYPEVTPDSIYKSSMLNKLKQIKAETGEVAIDDYKKINSDYGRQPGQWFNLKSEFEQFI